MQKKSFRQKFPVEEEKEEEKRNKLHYPRSPLLSQGIDSSRFTNKLVTPVNYIARNGLINQFGCIL